MYFEEMHPCFVVTDKSSVLLHPAEIQNYQSCADNADKNKDAYSLLVESLGVLVQNELS